MFWKEDYGCLLTVLNWINGSDAVAGVLVTHQYDRMVFWIVWFVEDFELISCCCWCIPIAIMIACSAMISFYLADCDNYLDILHVMLIRYITYGCIDMSRKDWLWNCIRFWLWDWLDPDITFLISVVGDEGSAALYDQQGGWFILLPI